METCDAVRRLPRLNKNGPIASSSSAFSSAQLEHLSRLLLQMESLFSILHVSCMRSQIALERKSIPGLRHYSLLELRSQNRTCVGVTDAEAPRSSVLKHETLTIITFRGTRGLDGVSGVWWCQPCPDCLSGTMKLCLSLATANPEFQA